MSMQGAVPPAVLRDRIGIGWRSELAAGILSNLDRIDIVEVLADDFFRAPRGRIRALRTLAAQVPIALHGVSLGLASSARADPEGLDRMARLCEAVRPDFWSEHLAFVRAGGVEIGHLAAPPRTAATVEGTVANLSHAASVVGAPPCVENVATLIHPPGSDREEAAWTAEILRASGCDLLLDLHNLHANATNFGFNPIRYLTQIPEESIAAIHLAGGKWVRAGGESRLLDDHLHDVPDRVYALLSEVGAVARRPLTVILERDGDYPPFEHLLRQIDRTRLALAAGRARRKRHAAKDAA